MSQRLPSLPSNRAFVVQFRLPSEDRPMVWEGRVEHVVSGQAQRCESQEQLWAFITHVLTALQSHCSPVRHRTWSNGGDAREQYYGEERAYAC
jgi:hypothetical protein